MDTAATIKELRTNSGMTRKEFSDHTGVPVRILEDGDTDGYFPNDQLREHKKDKI